MGWGDDLMWLGEANEVHKQFPDAVITDGEKFSPMWENIPWVVSPKYKGDKRLIYVNPKPNGNRWYIQGWGPGKIIYKPYKPKRAPYAIDGYESLDAAVELGRRCSRPVVVINPDTKNTTLANNKDWGIENWQRLTDLLNRHYDVVRLKPPGQVRDVSGLVRYNQPEILGTREFQRENIRDAWAFAYHADAIVTPEGGLHHFAAAVDTKAFVIYGGVITPEITGYEDQTNYVYDHPMTPCGSQTSCKHCKEGLASITPEQIYNDVRGYLDARQLQEIGS